jgi:DNA polymerase III subunit chi
MLDVEFHTGITDPTAFALRLLRKAYRQGARVLVTAPEPQLAELDRLLWTDDDRDFIAHARVSTMSAGMAVRTPLWLATAPEEAPQLQGKPDVLVNLGAAAAAEPQSLKRLIEVVSADPDEAARGRERWRAYKAQGLIIKHSPAGGAQAGSDA